MALAITRSKDHARRASESSQEGDNAESLHATLKAEAGGCQDLPPAEADHRRES